MSMAAGEYVSVSSQSDTERADLAIERAELAADPDIERDELAAIYVARGLDATLARQVADQLMAHDALGAHARDELGFSHVITARPVQAALASAGSFAVGAAMPLFTAAVAPERGMVLVIAATSLLFLIGLGGVAAGRRRCARVARGAARRVLGRAGDGVHGPRRLGLRRLDGVMAQALPKVRALTAGVDLETLGEWAPVETALGLLARARARLAREGFEVQLARLSLPPLLARLDPPRRWTSLAHVRQLDAMAGDAGVVVSVGPLAIDDAPEHRIGPGHLDRRSQRGDGAHPRQRRHRLARRRRPPAQRRHRRRGDARDRRRRPPMAWATSASPRRRGCRR